MEIVSGFRILKKLGEGGTARVYSAVRENGDSMPVALKVFRSEQSDSADLSRRIAAEVKAYRSLEHPNIVKVLDVVAEGGPALVLELVEGSTLSEFQNRLPYILPELSVRIVIEALKGIEHAHAASIVHRDLKPSNIMVSNDGRVLVADFGLAKVLGASVSTQTGTILGSPHYMSPEQARGDIVGPRSDLFSVTSVLYFLMTGTAPFNGESTLSVLATVIDRRMEPARQRNPKISWELSRLLEKGFSKQPSQRFESAREYREALEGYLANLGLGEDRLSISRFIEDPHGETLRAMNAVAEKIAERCEKSIRKGNRAESIELLSHLSLVAPNSQMIAELSRELDRKRSKKGWIFATAALASIALGGAAVYRGHSTPPVVAPVVLSVAPPVALVPVAAEVKAPAPVENPVVKIEPKAEEKPESKLEPKGVRKPAPAKEPVLVAESPTREAKITSTEVASNEPNPIVRERANRITIPNPTEIVNLDLPAGFSVEWDGQKIPSSQRSFRAALGVHKLVLKVGNQSYPQAVEVISGEPTEIRVNPSGGGSE